MIIEVSRKGLSPKQIAFLQSTDDEVLYGGARGGGKSHVSRIGCAEDCLKYPGRNVIFVRPTIKSAREQFTPAHMAKIVPREVFDEESKEMITIWKFNAQDSVFTFANGPDANNPFDGGSRLVLGGITTLQDAQESYQGIEFVSIWWDELTKADIEAIDYLKGSLRDVEYPVKFRAASNPGERSHKPVKERYVSPYYKLKKKYPDKFPADYTGKISWYQKIVDDMTGQEFKISISYIPATLDDNPIQNIREKYLKQLMTQPPHLRKMYREGSWDTFEGRYWEEVDTDRFFISAHQLQDYGIDIEWELENSDVYLSMDWGYKDYTAIYWHLETSKGVIVTFREEYMNKTLMEDVAAMVDKINKDLDIKPKGIYMPWDLYSSKGEQFRTRSGVVIGEELIDVWRYHCKVLDLKASSDRKLGWASMTQAMLQNVEIRKVHPGSHEMSVQKIPAWLILKDNVKHLKAQIESMQIDSSNPEDIKKGMEDHGVDACRMFWVAHVIKKSILLDIQAPPVGTGARIKHDILRRREEAQDANKRQRSVYNSGW